MITGLAVRNFKCLAQVPAQNNELLGFGPMNVLIGPNGCGKSSLLQAIDFLRAFFRSSVEVYLKERGWDYRDLPNLRRTQKNIHWSLTTVLEHNEHGHGAGTYSYHVSLQPRKHLGVGEERLTWKAQGSEDEEILLSRHGRKCVYLNRITGKSETAQMISLPASVISRWNAQREREKYPEMIRFREWIEDFRQYLIWDPKILRYPTRGRHSEIGQSGENLASVLGYLKNKKRSAFNKLIKRLRGLFPTVSDISISGGGWGWRTIRLHESNGGEVIFNSQQMSDGVLRLLAVMTMLYLDHIPSVITFEEPENGIHPQLIRGVVQVLRELTQRKPPNRCQVFFTTHSPYVLDEFYDHPDEVYCIERPKLKTGTIITRLSENRQLNVAQNAFKNSLGEAWFSGLIGGTAGLR